MISISTAMHLNAKQIILHLIHSKFTVNIRVHFLLYLNRGDVCSPTFLLITSTGDICRLFLFLLVGISLDSSNPYLDTILILPLEKDFRKILHIRITLNFVLQSIVQVLP